MYLAIYEIKVSKISSTHSSTSLKQHPTIKYEKRGFFALCNRNYNSEWFFIRKRLGNLGVLQECKYSAFF